MALKKWTKALPKSLDDGIDKIENFEKPGKIQGLSGFFYL